MKLSKNKEQKGYKRTSIGGQAVIEGVMMNGPHRSVLAVRSGKGEIIVEDVNKPRYREKCPILKIPVIRGVVAYIESMVLGYRTLMRSADLSGMTSLEDEPEEKENTKGQTENQAEQNIACENESGGNDCAGTENSIENENADNAENSENKDEKAGAKDDDKTGEPKKLSGIVLNAVMVISAMLGVALAMFLFMYSPTIIYNFFDNLGGGALTSLNLRGLIEGLMKLAIFIAYIALVSLTKDIKRLFQYHGAEHKCIHCFESGRELTPENCQEFYTLHPRCGTSFLVFVLVISLIVFSFLGWPNLALRILSRLLLIPFIAGISYEVLKWAGKSDNWFIKIISIPGLYLQKLTTAPPDNEQLEVAIAAVKAVMDEDAPVYEGIAGKDGKFIKTAEEFYEEAGV